MEKPKLKFIEKVVDIDYAKKVKTLINGFLNDIENDTSMPKSKEERDKAFAELRRRFAKKG